MIKKSGAKLLILKAYVNPVLLKTTRYGHERVGVTTNGTRAILTLDKVEQEPIWLLDLRRNAVPFIWLWGEEGDWKYINASEVARNKATVLDNLNSATAENASYFELLEGLKFHQFSSDLVAHAYDNYRNVFLDD
ncbi:hypothetical protein [Acinetobacter sp. A47]|uniref:hypothetical protein n=1 Tax=Acinetobacter sp. A47 TaxID=1561217 RepID=UPI00056E4AC3|nr:hypothetical protein [Acinetobacter sp. A47]